MMRVENGSQTAIQAIKCVEYPDACTIQIAIILCDQQQQ